MERGEIDQTVQVVGRGRSSTLENGSNPVRSLIEQQWQRFHVGTISEYCLMWSDLAADTVRRRVVSPEVHQTISNISVGIDYLAFTKRYDQLSHGQRSYIPQKFSEIRQEEGIDRVTFSYDDAKMLQLAAAVVNIPYDPGEPEDTPENIKKRTFVFADLEGMLPTTNVVDAEQ